MLTLIRARREDRNRLGIGLQLALLRHPGASLAQILDRSVEPPREFVTFIAEQLDIPPAMLGDYAVREQTIVIRREVSTPIGVVRH